jgi:diadenosine tetraphosphate (Ap4A) HIT family hydrolase
MFGCELCKQGALAHCVEVWAGDQVHVIRVLDAPEFPGFYRVIWNAHIPEFSDLSAADQAHCMQVVSTVERVMRDGLKPDKINLAALGNMVPHLHWHVIARFNWDSHFPQPIWGDRQRTPVPAAHDRLLLPLAELDRRVASALTGA